MADPVSRALAPRRGGHPLVLAGMVVLALLAIVGGGLAVTILRPTHVAAAGPALADPAAPDLALGQPVRTSFGSMVASDAEVNNGLSDDDLGGMSHGVSSLVGTGSAQVNVVVTLTNTGRRTVETAAGQFRLLTGRNGVPAGPPILPQATSMQAGSLIPGATVDARVTFVTLTDGSQLWLQYADPAGGRPIRIALGSTSKIDTPAGSHQH
jgi:hypothetical protein